MRKRFKIIAQLWVILVLSLGIVAWADTGGRGFHPTDRADQSIETKDILDGAVTSGKIADGGVAEGDLATNAVTSGKISDGTLITDDLATNAVTSGKIADGTIIADDIAAGAVASSEILDGTVAAGDMAFDVIASVSGADLEVDIGSFTNGQASIVFNHSFSAAPYVFLSWVDNLALEPGISNVTLSAYAITVTNCIPSTYAPVTGGLTNGRYMAIYNQ